MEKCSICSYIPEINDIPLETHHIIPQKDCKDKKIISKMNISMNHITNLCVLCQKCHDDVDRNILIINGYKDTSKGLILDYYYKEKNDNINIK
jgi:5-methylcytosine-specific restriction endonuclease McrA